MLAFPNIKINLGLWITEKRADGYHNLLTCFYPVQWTDVLEIVPQDEFQFVQTGLQVPGNTADNLCVKAYQLLKRDHSLPNSRIHLHKIIPMGAGLGGGSADAAFVLKTLNELYRLKLDKTMLEKYAAQLGSDCAFFIGNRPAVGTGRGELLEEVDLTLKGNHILIVYPSVHVSTADAFAGVRPRAFEGDFGTLLQEPTRWKNELHNQFEETVFPKHGILSNIKKELYQMGAWYAAMSGSGSAIFGLFKEEPPHDRFAQPSFRGML